MARVEQKGPIRVRMKETKQGTFDGFTIITFWAGKEYDLNASLAREFAPYYEVVTEKKNAGVAPENKAASAGEKK